MSNRAVIYARSSKDRSDVSIDAQRRSLHELAATKGLVIVDEFTDAVESGKDDDRPGFQALIRALRDRSRGWENVVVLDTSRIARRREIAMMFERECEKHGIAVHYRNVPDTDPITNMLLRSIFQAMDEWHSLNSKAKGLAGMAENVRQGWRAGGRAPKGYKLEYHATGAIRDGIPVLKSKLMAADDAPLVAEYLKCRARGQARGALMERMKLEWPFASLNSIEWQALTYAGHTVWNVHNERTSDGYKTGEKRRPRSEWLVTRDTHPALITDDEAESILRQLEQQRIVASRDREHQYLLTGLLVTPDGKQFAGEWDRKMDAGLYRVGRGKRISAVRVDKAVIDLVMRDLHSDDVVNRVLRSVQAIVSGDIDGRAIAGKEKKLAVLTHKIGKLVDLLTEAEGPGVDAYKRSIALAEAERAALMDELAEMRAQLFAKTEMKHLGADGVRRLLRLFSMEIEREVAGGDLKAIKAALGGLIDKIVLDPESETFTIHARINPTTGLNLASPRDDETTPVAWQSDGAVAPRWAA